MATTTNYGWTTPDDTALVKDGAAAIRTLGTSVDTTTKNLNPSTTLGDIEYRSSTANVNTRLPLGTAGQVLKVNSGATAPEWATDASGMTNPMTTTGDTIYSSSGSTPARLGIGSTGQVLTVAAGIPSWATPGGSTKSYALINSGGTTLSGASTTISGLSGYDNLMVLIRDASTTVASDTLLMRVNSSSTASDYIQFGATVYAGATYVAADIVKNINYYQNTGNIYIAGNGTAASNMSGYIEFRGANESGVKPFTSSAAGRGGTDATAYMTGGTYNGTSVISSVTFLSSGGSLDNGTVYIYGAV
jgi:hypothetical protein